MSIIEHSSIKRVSQDDGLESITLRSDLAARYIFLNETLLEGLGVVQVDDKFKKMLDLKEVIKDEDNNIILDEMEYLRKWENQLKEEVEREENKGDNLQSSNEVLKNNESKLNQLIKSLDGTFKDEKEFEDLCQSTYNILKDQNQISK